MITPGYSPTVTERVLPRMALDFTTASLDSRVTVTRALNTATRINSSGYIEIVNANLPRFDFSPTSVGTCRGLLIEESRANLVLQSSDFTTASWTKTDTTPTAASGTSPDGTNTATLLTQGSAATSEVWQSFVVGAGNTVTYSRYVKPGNAQWYMLQIRNGGATSFAYAFFDLTNGVVGSTSSSGGFATLSGSTITNVGNGWFRVTFTVMIGASFGTAVFASSSVAGNNNAAPLSGGTRYEWGCQAEVGTFATSYIPTTTASLTRNADVAEMTGTNFSDWYNANEGTFVAHLSTTQPTEGGVARRIVNVTDGSENNRIFLAYAGAINVAPALITTAGVSQTAFLAPTGGYPVSSKLAISYKSNDVAFCINGGSVSVDTTATIPTVNQMRIGALVAGGTSVNNLQGCVGKILYYPLALSDGEIQAITK